MTAQSEEPDLMTRVGRGLQRFSAGMTGDLPLYEKQRLAKVKEVQEVVTALEHGIDMRRGLEGDAAKNFDEMYGGQLDKLMPGMKQTFMALAQKPTLLKQFEQYANYMPEPMQVMMKNDPKGFLKFAGTVDGQKMLESAKDRLDMRVATKKVQTTMLGLDQFVPKHIMDDIKADGVMTASDVMKVQPYLPKEMQLSEAEMQAVQKNDKIFWNGLGVMHGPAEQEALKRRADRGTSAPQHMTIDGKVYQFDPDQKVSAERLGRDKRYALMGSAQGTEQPLTEDAVDIFAREALKDKGVLGNLGRGAQGAQDLRRITNRMASILKEEGGPGTAEQRAAFKADSASLGALTKTFDAITAFENTAVANGRALVGLAKKVDDTGVPVVERWIRAGRKSVKGDPDVSEFHAQLSLFGNEAAKILSNPSMSGVLTDTARKEVQEFLPKDASAAQIERVVSRLETDFGNRKKSTVDQMDAIKTRMSGRKPASPSGDTPAPAALKEGEESTSKSGRPIVVRNGKWEYR